MSDEPDSRSPEPEEVLRKVGRYFISGVNTTMPGKVVEYYPDTQSVDVQPTIQRRKVNEDGTETVETLPIIPDVPLKFPRTDNFSITFPIKKGHLVELSFSQFSLDNWLRGQGEITDPNDFRMHDLTDAVAEPGLYPFPRAIADIDKERMTLGHHSGGKQIHIAEDHVQITFDNGNTLRLEGKEGNTNMQVGDGAKHVAIVEYLEILYNLFKSVYDGHGHSIPAAGLFDSMTGAVTGIATSTGPSASAPTWDSAIKSTKVSIPDG